MRNISERSLISEFSYPSFRLLEDILGDEDNPQMDVSDLEDFLPPGVASHQLHIAVRELQQAITASESSDISTIDYAWLRQETSGGISASSSSTPDLIVSNPREQPSAPVPSNRILYSELRVNAIEFKPPAPKGIPDAAGRAAGAEESISANEGFVTYDMQQLNIRERDEEYSQLKEEYYDEEEDGEYYSYYESGTATGELSSSAAWDYNSWNGKLETTSLKNPPSAGRLYNTNNNIHTSNTNIGFETSNSGSFPGYSAFPPSGGVSNPQQEAAFFAVLEQQFPQYSAAALQDVFTRCGRSFPETLDMLYRLENEIHGQYAAKPTIKTAQKPSKPAANFSADDFPTLGGPTPTGSATTNSTGAVSASVSASFSASNYAGKAKAAAHLPAPVASKPGSRRGSNPSITTTSAAGGGAAPVWESQGVRKFSTGIAVDAEYAEARATARDHARARNACFEQATQAYLVGNKALAKELGAKGRFHNEQMKAAHAVAAADTFSRRNTAAVAALEKAGSGSRL